MAGQAFNREARRWLAEYEALPLQSRPEFLDWFYRAYSEFVGISLLHTVLVSGRASKSLSAAIAFLEFTKAKPKSRVEVSAPVNPTSDVTREELLELALRENDVDPEL